jgi:hypothetical protein
MVMLTFTELVKAAHQLSPAEKVALLRSLQPEVATEETSLTREQAIAELEALQAAGAFEHVESMRGKYARPDLADVSDEELNTYLQEIGGAWEDED